MQAMESFSSPSPSSPSYPDLRFCLTGLHTSSEQSNASKETVRYAKQTRFREMKMTSEGQSLETGSDSDSGNWTVFSDNLESPMRDSPPLSFPTGFHCDSSCTTTKRTTEEQRTRNREDKALHKTGFENEDIEENADDGYPVSPSYGINYDRGLVFPADVSYLSKRPQPCVSGFVYPLEKSNHFQSAEPELLFHGRRRDGSAISTGGINPQFSLSYSSSSSFTPDISGTPDVNNNDLPDARTQLRAKCEDLFGSREIRSRIGSRQDISSGIYPETGTRVQRPGHESDPPLHGSSPTSCYDVRTSESIFRGIDDVTGSHDQLMTSNNDAIGDVISSRSVYDERPSDVSYLRHLGLNDSLSTISTAVYTDFFLPPNHPSEVYGRRYVRHQVVNHPAVKQWYSPSKGYRYAKRSLETSFNSTVGGDSQGNGDGSPWEAGSPRRMNPGEYRRARSFSQEFASSGTWKGDLEEESSCSRTLGIIHPAMQQPFSEELPATLPRPNKPRVPPGDASTAFDRTIPGQARERHRHTARRCTNPGLTETEPNRISSDPRASRSSTQSGTRFSISSILKSKRHPSTTSLASQSGTETGSVLESGEATSIRSGRSSHPVFEMVNLDSSGSSSAPGTPTKNDRFHRSSSFPNPDGRTRASGTSLLQKIRTRLTPSKRKQNSPTTNDVITTGQQHRVTASQPRHDGPNHVTRSQDHQSIYCDVISGDAIPIAKGNGRLLRFHSLQESTDDLESTDPMRNFSTLQLQKSRAGNQRESSNTVSPADRNTTVAALRQNSETFSERGTGEGRQNVPPPGEVITVLCEVDEFISMVEAHATSKPGADEDKTILEEHFDECKHDMIHTLKNFIESCKLMVVRTPASSSGFLEELSTCRRLLGGVINRYRPLADCTSLPADRAKFADGLNAVAASFQETVIEASLAAGRTAKHPTVRRLRDRAKQLVIDLTDLMRMIREMNYNRLSRRF